MTPFSLVIPAGSADNLVACVRALLQHEPNLEPRQIIVVDDGGKVRPQVADIVELQAVRWIEGETPFVFSRNVNAGIRAARRDCVVLGDDGLLQTDHGLSALAETCSQHPKIGLLSAAITGVVGNPFQKLQEPVSAAPRIVGDTLMFVAVYVPWSTWVRVGELDERLSGYGFDDNDYCLRTREAGLSLAVSDGCVVEHGERPSVYRSRGDLERLFSLNRRLFNEKLSARSRLSFAMIARNEEFFIAECLRSVQDVAAEMIVAVDSRSRDATADIAVSYGAVTVELLPYVLGDFASMRNAATDLAARVGGRDALLMLDADERLTQAGREMLPRCLASMPGDCDGWGFELEDRTLDERYLATVGTVPRLFVLDPALRWQGYCHERLVWSDGRRERFGHVSEVPAIVHYGHDPHVQRDRRKHERNIVLLNQWLAEHPKDGPMWLSLAEELFELGELGNAKRAAGRAQATGYRFPPHRIARIDQIRRPGRRDE